MTDGLTPVWQIIEGVLAWIFPPYMLEMGTFRVLIAVAEFALGAYFLYLVLIKPFVIFFRLIKGWSCRR